MKTNLDRLLDEIDPSITLDVTERIVTSALEQFHVVSNIARNGEEAREILAEFMRQTRNALWGTPSDVGFNELLNLLEVYTLFEEEFPNNTQRTVDKIMTSGAEGGVYGILRILANKITEQYNYHLIHTKVMNYWDSLSSDEMFHVANEYYEKYPEFLPPHLDGNLTNTIRFSFWKVLDEHPYMIKRLRNMG